MIICTVNIQLIQNNTFLINHKTYFSSIVVTAWYKLIIKKNGIIIFYSVHYLWGRFVISVINFYFKAINFTL